MKCPVVSFEMSMGLVWLWPACILKLRAMFLCCWRICMVCLALELVGSWVVLGFSVGVGGFWMCSYRLMFPGVRSSLVFSGFGLKPPASGFQSYPYSTTRLLHLLFPETNLDAETWRKRSFTSVYFGILKTWLPEKHLLLKKIQYRLEELLQKKTAGYGCCPAGDLSRPMHACAESVKCLGVSPSVLFSFQLIFTVYKSSFTSI